MNCVKCKKEIPEGAPFCCWCGSKQEKRDHIKRANGTGTVFKRGDKYVAQVCVYDPIARTLSRTFERRKDAFNALPGMRQELLERNGRSKIKRVQTFKDIYEEWSTSAAEKLSKSKQTAYRIAWKRCEAIEESPVSEVTIGELQQLIKGLSFYQSRDVKSLLSHIYQRACAQGDAVSNLSQFIILPDLEEKEAEAFRPEEVELMWTRYNDGDHMIGHALLMIYTGMMPGELIECNKESVDLENRRITGAGKKTKERKVRSILLPKVIVPVVSDLMSMSTGKTLIGMNKDRWYEEYHSSLKRAGVRDLPPYSCRHTTATVLALDETVAPMLITKAMRQVTPKITERYKHAEEGQILDAMDKALGTALGTQHNSVEF